MKTLGRNGVLNELEKLGKKVAVLADPNHYPAEKRDRAKSYEPMLKATRYAYYIIREGGNVIHTLKGLRGVIETGVERNRLELIITATTTGFSESNSWDVVDDAITFKS